nr:hypothetical protein [Paraburkholderia phytofirmans]
MIWTAQKTDDAQRSDIIGRRQRHSGVEAAQCVDRVVYDNLNPKTPDLRDVFSLAWCTRLNGTCAKQHANLRAMRIRRAARNIAQHREARFAGTEHENVLSRSDGGRARSAALQLPADCLRDQ